LRPKAQNLDKYVLKTQKIDGFEQFTLVEQLTGSHFSCIPAIDAMVSGLCIQHDNKSLALVPQIQSAKELTFAQSIFSGIVLFPFANRLAKGKYNFNGKEYQFPINEEVRSNNLHAILDKDFKVHSIDLQMGTIALKYEHPDTDRSFPFAVELTVTYRLHNKRFTSAISVINRNNHNIPMGIGAHPYYNFDQDLEGLLLELPSSKFVQVNEQMIPNGHLVEDAEFAKMKRIGQTELDNCFVLDDRNVCHIYAPSWDINFYLEQNKDVFPYMHVFLLKEKNLIALEPVSCIPNAFNNGVGLIELEAGENLEADFSIYIQ